MRFSTFITAPEHDLTIIVKRDIFHVKETGRQEELMDAVSSIQINPLLLKKLDLKIGERVELKNGNGSVVVSVRVREVKDKRCDKPEELPAVMLNSIYSNSLSSSTLNKNQTLDLKKLKVKISKTEKELTTISEIIDSAKTVK